MLWTDERPREPDEELRRAQARLRRAMVVVAVAAFLAMALACW